MRVAGAFANQVTSVAVGWQVYDLTRDPFDLGLVGLIQFLPAVLLVLVTGAVADRYPRKAIILTCNAVYFAGSLGLLLLTLAGNREVGPIFLALGVIGMARAFNIPATTSLLPSLVPTAILAAAFAWSSSAWQIATVLGPMTGGLLYDLSAAGAFAAAIVLNLLATGFAAALPATPRIAHPDGTSWNALLGGIRYVWTRKAVLGAISLDMLAVLMGGAVALLPAVARDILDAGPTELGLLRAASGVGAILMALYLARHPIRDRAGWAMLGGVAAFGLGNALFGWSSWLWLSVLALLLVGAGDMVSVVVRQTVVQLWTPDRLRGRVNAVNAVFIGASNELGEFRAGTMAAWLGIVPAIVLGGIGAAGISVLWGWIFPDLRRIRRLDEGAARL
ncbi:MAG: MFS transporter [Alphaproteobacteria bacterium]|nr:MFS transporter [Alphaproteobacteria bacterium]